MKAPTFIDQVRVRVFAGAGGDGCSSFRREKYIPYGGPDGGDGGRGGSVILRADKNVDSLLPLYYQPLQRATPGERGRGAQQYGRDGEDRIIPVPCGTEVRLWPEEGAAGPGDWLGEVLEDGQTLLVARGGKGGKGNMHFATPSHQAPREFTCGTPGEEKVLRLELKTIADIGLVGYPNAGKSTLLAALTPAHPKIAAYPFTTLHPQIGTLVFEDYRTLRLADIPGLVEGAHAGVGLGHDFLRHIERTRYLLFVLDMAGTDGRDPVADYRSLRRELKRYNPTLAQRPYLIVANKMDSDEATAHFKAFKRRTRQKPLAVSAVLGEGLDALKARLEAEVLGAAPSLTGWPGGPSAAPLDKDQLGA